MGYGRVKGVKIRRVATIQYATTMDATCNVVFSYSKMAGAMR
jgi:hypothetical protein